MSKELPESPLFDYFVLVCIAIASVIGINQYHYGMWNQFISIPWLHDLLDPSLFPKDLLIEQREASPSFFLAGLKAIMNWTNASMALVHFVLYLIALLATVFSFYFLGKAFHGSRKAGLLAASILCFAFPAIGDVQTWDSLLMERTLALPLLVFSISFMLQKNWWPMLVLQGLAFLVHPLSALYLIFISGIVILMVEGWTIKIFGYTAVLLLLASPILYLKFSSSTSESLFGYSEIWMEVMRLRNGHHAFPSAYPLLIWIKTIAIGLLFGALLKWAHWSKGQAKVLKGFGLGMLIMLALGIVFTELYPIKLIIQLQFFRSFLFLILLSVAMWSASLFKDVKPLFYMLIPLLLLQFYQVDISKLAGMLLMGSLTWLLYSAFSQRTWKAPTLALAFLVLGAAAWHLRGGLNIDEGKQKASWYAVQDWFAEHSAKDALAIVPPGEIGFRVRSLRSSYGDWFDGTKAFFSEEYAQYWADHMFLLDAKDPRNLKESFMALSFEHLYEVAQREANNHSEVYLVHFQNAPILPMVEVFSNEDYRVYRMLP